MAVLDFHRSSSRRGASFLARATTNVLSHVLTWNDARKTEKVLSQLSDHELDDIGLSRGTIGSLTGR